MALGVLRKVAAKSAGFGYRNHMVKAKVMTVMGVIFLIVAVGVAIFKGISVGLLFFVVGLFTLLGSVAERHKARRYARTADILSQ